MGPDVSARLPQITPLQECRLRLLTLERIKDHLILEEEYLLNVRRHAEGPAVDDPEIAGVEQVTLSDLMIHVRP